jgi:MoaA/NifB/PqqE/SkfB family radical SAM enzyme
LDGPPRSHDAMRGERAHERAIAGALAAREAGVEVELTCVVGRHNAKHIDELLDFVESLGLRVVFQPARNSLFLETERDGSEFQLEGEALRAAFRRIEARKRRGSGVANRWSSLRHFRNFPNDVKLPCAAGWINVTLDPEGSLYHCGQFSRSVRSYNVVREGVAAAFERLNRAACKQCWCARVVEENYAWGGRFDTFLPPRRPGQRNPVSTQARKRQLPVI